MRISQLVTAACHDQPYEVFFGGKTAEAAAICYRCPLMWPCRYEALELPSHEQYGMAGGLCASVRVKIRRQWKIIDRQPMIERQALALAESRSLRA